MTKGIVKFFAAFVVAALAVFIAPTAFAQASCGNNGWNYTGNWAQQPDKNGMGLVVTHQGCTMLLLFFVYNNTQDPTWYYSSGRMSKDAQQRDVYAGTLQRLHGTPPMGYNVAALQLADVGSVSMTFTGQYSAVMTYKYPDPVSGSSQEGTLNLVPNQFGCELPAMWNGRYCVAPMGVKVATAKQLPAGCNSGKDQCWKDAIANGTVKLVETSAKMTGKSDRPIMIAYYKNSSTTFGTSGLWNALQVYAEDGSPVGSDIYGGSSVELDWVYGMPDGVVFHDASRGICGKSVWDPSLGIWDNHPTTCP